MPASELYGTTNTHLYAYDHTGKFKWENLEIINVYLKAHPGKNIVVPSYAEPVIADLDGDGKPEIVVGSTAFNGDGSVKWAGHIVIDGYWHGCNEWSAIVADLDLDGKQEVVCGNTAYNADGTIKWWNKSIPSTNYFSYAAAVNFNDNAYPEIVLQLYNKLYLLDHNGNIIWGPIIPDPVYPLEAPPIVADFDGDGELEIGIQCYGGKYCL